MNPIKTDPSRITERDRSRFWRNVNKDGPTPTHRPELGPCWLWVAGKFSDGYGCAYTQTKGHRHNARAHRVAWEMMRGEIPDGFSVCHHCDNPPCVNPDHLFPAPPKANTGDALAKGRMSMGERHTTARISEADAREILRRRHAGESNRKIAVRFGVSPTHVSAIANGKRWAFLSRAPSQKSDPVPARHALK